MKFPPIPVWIVAVLSAGLAGCSHDLDENSIRPRAQSSPMPVESEQVTLNFAQVNCGVENGLWEAPSSDSQQRTIYRLTQKARDLQFSDDIYTNDPDSPVPYTQLRGKFYLQMDGVIAIHDGTEAGTKLVQAPISVKIPHACFAAPLPIMGVRQQKFTASVAPTMVYENGDDGWQPTHLVH